MKTPSRFAKGITKALSTLARLPSTANPCSGATSTDPIGTGSGQPEPQSPKPDVTASAVAGLDLSVFRGFVCTNNGIILEMTFADRHSHAVGRALFATRRAFWTPCDTPGCGCTENVLALMPGVKVHEATIRLEPSK